MDYNSSTPVPVGVRLSAEVVPTTIVPSITELRAAEDRFYDAIRQLSTQVNYLKKAAREFETIHALEKMIHTVAKLCPATAAAARRVKMTAAEIIDFTVAIEWAKQGGPAKGGKPHQDAYSSEHGTVRRKTYEDFGIPPSVVKVLSNLRRQYDDVDVRNSVYSPLDFARYVVKWFLAQIKRGCTILEPCVGMNPKGRIGWGFFDAYPTYCIRNHCQKPDSDFFDWIELVNWIITNPPWTVELLNKFIAHAVDIADNIVFVLPLRLLTSSNRLHLIRSYSPGIIKEVHGLLYPKGWPRWGFQLAAVHMQRGFAGETKWSGFIGQRKKDLDPSKYPYEL